MTNLNIDTPAPASEFSVEFIDGMLNRMGVSYHKYGALKDAYPHDVDAIKSLKQRLARYEEDGNTEWLMDVANFCMIEFMHPGHESAHFEPQDSDTSPGRTTTGGSVTVAENNSRSLWV